MWNSEIMETMASHQMASDVFGRGNSLKKADSEFSFASGTGVPERKLYIHMLLYMYIILVICNR